MAVDIRRQLSRRNKVAPQRFVRTSDSEEDGEGEGECANPQVHHAASTGDTRQLVHVVQQDPTLLEQQNAEGLTPLGQAVLSQQMTAAKRLVKMGANINAQDGIGRTCLSIAAYQGWLEGVVYLLRNGARHNIGDKAGRYPIHAATYDHDHRTLVTLLQTLSLADVNQQDHEDMTALHWAAFHKRPEHVRCLMEKGASVLLRDMDGKLPLHWAAQNGCAECCRLLLQDSSDEDRDTMLRAQDQSGKTAVHFAAAAGHADIVSLLAAHPACLCDVEDPDDRTPLHWAAAMGQAQCVHVLLDLKAKANAVDADGGTPLSYASQSGHKECVRLLEKAMDLPRENTDVKKPPSTSSRKSGKNPLGFLKGLFQSNRKGNAMTSRGKNPSSRPDRTSAPTGKQNPFTTNTERSSKEHNSSSHADSMAAATERTSLSLPSIGRQDSNVKDLAQSFGAAHSTISSLPPPPQSRIQSEKSGRSSELGTPQRDSGGTRESNRSYGGGSTHIPVLPPLLPDLHPRVSTIPCESVLGPLRGVTLSKTRQLSGRVHDGMLFQKNATDFWTPPSNATSLPVQVTDTGQQGLKGRKRGRKKPRHQGPPPLQPPMTTARAHGDITESYLRGEGLMTEDGGEHPHDPPHFTTSVHSRLQTTTVPAPGVQYASDQHLTEETGQADGTCQSPGVRDSVLFVEASSVSIHARKPSVGQRDRHRLISRKSDLKLLDV